MCERERKEQSAAQKVGVDYAVKLSYAAADASDLANKRDVVYSLLCFGCMFDDAFATDPDPIVRKYDCLSAPEPKKIDLYALALTLVTLPAEQERRRELEKSWFMLFGYVLAADAPHDPDLFAKLKERLHTPRVFEDVLQSRYSVYIPATEEELAAQNAPSLLVQWYAPYLAYCAERDEKGCMRYTRECHRLLARGDYEELLLRAEQLLAAFPDDTQVALADVAARVSLSGATSKEARTALLQDTLSLIDEYIDVSPSLYFRYYRGLTLLGLMDAVGARREFEACLAADPSFELAALMLKGMDSYDK